MKAIWTALLLAVLPLTAQGQTPPAQTPQPAADQAKLDAETFKEAGLKADDLMSRGWTFQTLRSLAAAIRLGCAATKAHQAAHPNPVSDAYGNGTMTNIDESIKAGIRGVRNLAGDDSAKEDQKENYKRGCVAHQGAVMAALNGKKAELKGMEIRRVMLGWGLEHHAVVVFPDGNDWEKAGVVLDGWYNQSSKPGEMVFLTADWKSNFKTHRLISSTHLED